MCIQAVHGMCIHAVHAEDTAALVQWNSVIAAADCAPRSTNLKMLYALPACLVFEDLNTYLVICKPIAADCHIAGN